MCLFVIFAIVTETYSIYRYTAITAKIIKILSFSGQNAPLEARFLPYFLFDWSKQVKSYIARNIYVWGMRKDASNISMTPITILIIPESQTSFYVS